MVSGFLNKQYQRFYTENNITPFGETPEELKQDLAIMLLAFNKPILEEDEQTETLKEI